MADRSEENTLLIAGEKGGGKSTTIHRLQEWLTAEHGDLNIRSVDIPAKIITAEAVATLLGAELNVDLSGGPAELVKTDGERQPTVIILENAHNFFLREVGGLAGWEALLSFTHARLSNIFWVISVNSQSWAYLSNVFGRDYQFSSVTYTRPWSLNDIRSLVLSRNQLSGFRIRYDSILLSTRGPEAGSIRNAEQLYFSLLWDACRGNPMLALQMWLGSITVNRQIVTVGLPVEVNAAALEKLGEELHFVYAALVMHENMTSDELVAVTAIPHGVVRSALKTAFDTGFIERTILRRYRIVPLWYPAITKFLARKNLLHE
ncbi:AAA family ATPase [Oceanicoccus sp. KOV_DT_Chl]|uniref:AAA family ATPase n=1 Tax=Oceanicoccus sp. KOV_DT_Chl TaxID=1904639 RepID=UPI000C7E0C73|nr:AAA family ATPase [Oceanicoccus sp. KOV_DT_Chl]